jgi:outer membrane receptor protein involved in Fe transport
MRAIASVGATVLGVIVTTCAVGQQAIPNQSSVKFEEFIVTAQKRTENIQDVPIAVSAFSEAELAMRGIEGGRDIPTAVPNVTFSKTNFTSYNLQIRGIGTKLISGTADFGVGIHENNAPLTVSRFSEADFYDIDRIEVLRGPQGTLYGRNATGGVFNVLTAKPSDNLQGRREVAPIRALVDGFHAFDLSVEAQEPRYPDPSGEPKANA